MIGRQLLTERTIHCLLPAQGPPPAFCPPSPALQAAPRAWPISRRRLQTTCRRMADCSRAFGTPPSRSRCERPARAACSRPCLLACICIVDRLHAVCAATQGRHVRDTTAAAAARCHRSRPPLLPAYPPLHSTSRVQYASPEEAAMVCNALAVDPEVRGAGSSFRCSSFVRAQTACCCPAAAAPQLAAFHACCSPAPRHSSQPVEYVNSSTSNATSLV